MMEQECWQEKKFFFSQFFKNNIRKFCIIKQKITEKCLGFLFSSRMHLNLDHNNLRYALPLSPVAVSLVPIPQTVAVVLFSGGAWKKNPWSFLHVKVSKTSVGSQNRC